MILKIDVLHRDMVGKVSSNIGKMQANRTNRYKSWFAGMGWAT